MRSTAPIDLTGKKFGRLFVIDWHGHVGPYRAWNCKCDCGNTKVMTTGSLRSGHGKSCGCLQKEIVSKIAKANLTTHGMSHTPVFNSWNSMIQRCYNKKSESFNYYGGRGIVVCEFLRASPENLKSLLGERVPGYSLERTDVNSNYSCGQCAECLSSGWARNVKWGSHKEQARNKRNTLMVTIDGETKCAAEWEEIYGLYDSCISNRIRLGYSGKKLLMPCKKQKELFITIGRQSKRISEWAKISGLNPKTIWKRHNDGWSGDRLLKPSRFSK